MRDRTTLLRVATAVVAILAVGLAGGALPTAIDGGAEGIGTGTGGNGDGTAPVDAPEPTTPEGGSGPAPWFFEILLLALVVLCAAVVAWYLVFERRELAKLAAVGLAIAAFVLVLVSLVGEATLEAQEVDLSPGMADLGDEDAGGAGSGDTTPSQLELLALAIAVVASIFAAGVLLSRSDGRSSADEIENATDGHRDGAAEVGTVAGRAADRIGTGGESSLDNEIYRAWREMTELLDVDRPASSTPGEFADAAVDAGMRPVHVEELTGLFEAARYGGVEPTPDRERRAVDVLRRIERAYGNATANAGADTTADGGTAANAGADTAADAAAGATDGGDRE